MTAWPAEESLAVVDFERFRQTIESETGIHLSDAKRGLLVARLSRRVRALGMTSLREYFEYVERGGDPIERTRMFDAISTNETRFFREPHHFEVMTSRIFPRWKALATRGARERRIRIWSAGCSSGEEPYSVAMALLETFDADEWDLRVDATDLSTRVLDIARRGEWPARKAADVPEPLLRRYMLRGTRSQEGVMKAGDAVRGIVRFGRQNLMEEPYPMENGYDMILCRNVLIYLGHANRVRVVHNLLSHLAAGGFFFVGHAETLAGIADGPKAAGPNVYVK